MNHFYSKLTFTILLIFLIFFSQAQSFIFPENQGKDAFKITSSNQEKIELSFALDQFQLDPITVDGEAMSRLTYGLNLVPGKEGAPDLPFIAKNFLIPNGANVNVVLVTSEQEIYENVNISPSAKIPFDTEPDFPLVRGVEYSKNQVYPNNPIEIRTTEVRGMNIAEVGISPFLYNPISKQLVVYKNMEFEIQISNSGNGYGESRFRSPFWDQILMDLVENTQDIPNVDYNKRHLNSKDIGCEYLIVVPNNPDFIVWADTIKKFRNEQGIATKIVTIDEIGGNDVNTLENFFNDVYNTWNPVPSAVLLMADYGEDENTITSIRFTHPYEGSYITDNYYADVTNNNLPDFVFARMFGRSYEEFELMVHKFMNYEQNPPTLESFYNEPITALGWQTERWFQICSETVGGYMKNTLGKNPNRINAIYDGDPDVDPWSTANNTGSVMNYFGPNGLNYLPSTPSELGEWTGGTPQDIINALNAGSFILQHRDHGYYSGWGEPAFNTSHINSLTNVNLLTHVFSINCQTGQFDEGTTCFAEKFMRHENGGAVSITAPTQVSYSFVNDALVWGLYDNMWPDFMPDYGNDMIPERDFRPAFGLASGKYFLSSTNWAGASMKIITFRLFHHHGDAFGSIYTEVPINNEVAFEQGITTSTSTLQVTAAPGSLIGLTVDGELIASGFCSEAGIAELSFAEQTASTKIKIVITKQNYFRVEGEILVVPSEGAYVIETNHSINDNASNGNGIIEYNEDISLSFTIKNVGVDLAENVVISIESEDPYIQIVDGSEVIGNMDSGQEIELNDAFSFHVPVNIPDNHIIEFQFSATNGIDNWVSNFTYKAFAPVLNYSLISFEEISGNGNGYLDPGETALASFEVINTGHVSFPSGVSSLVPNSSYIEINSENQNFDQIEAGGTFVSQFEITTSASTPSASIASIINHIQAEPFDVNTEMFFNIGLVVEDWEMENFSKFNWQFGGDNDWIIADDYVEEGDFSAKADDVNDGENAILSLNYDVVADHEISFYMQISSEENHDFLFFYIDDVLQESWSGLVLFEQFSFPVTAGEHEFKWEFAKDSEGHSGLDAAWLDFIILPPGQTITSIENTNNSTKDYYRIYPNPTHDIINLDLLQIDEKNIQFTILNSLGQLKYRKSLLANNKQYQIDLSFLEKGLYILQLQTAKGESFTKKIMIN